MPENGDLAVFDLFLARYLQTHGKRNEAIHYWKERLASTDVASYFRTFAGAALCDLGLTPESYKALLEESSKAEAKAKKQDGKESNKEDSKPKIGKPAGPAAESGAYRCEAAWHETLWGQAAVSYLARLHAPVVILEPSPSKAVSCPDGEDGKDALLMPRC